MKQVGTGRPCTHSSPQDVIKAPPLMLRPSWKARVGQASLRGDVLRRRTFTIDLHQKDSKRTNNLGELDSKTQENFGIFTAFQHESSSKDWMFPCCGTPQKIIQVMDDHFGIKTTMVFRLGIPHDSPRPKICYAGRHWLGSWTPTCSNAAALWKSHGVVATQNLNNAPLGGLYPMDPYEIPWNHHFWCLNPMNQGLQVSSKGSKQRRWLASCAASAQY